MAMRRIILLLVLLMLGYTHALKAQITDVYAGNDTIELRLNNYQYGFIQWQTSQDTIHWKDIEDATDTVYRFLPTENAYYRALAFFDNCPDVTSRVCYVQVPPKADAGSDRKLMQGSGGDHDYVDLGLPSGTLWATCNIGANTPEEYGDYFAWGETAPKDVYNWSTYQYCMGSYNILTKYCTNSDYGYNGFTDNMTILLPEDDAATANWGNGWRMPTKEEWWELFDNTTNTWTTQNGVTGHLFTASNGNSLFLPAAGYRWDDDVFMYVGSDGYYWSSSLDTDIPGSAWNFYFSSDDYSVYYIYYRNDGHSVRAVRSSRLN